MYTSKQNQKLHMNAKTHPRREEDGGGCRCQAFAFTGDEKEMDPTCSTAQHHETFVIEVEKLYSEPTDLKLLKSRRVSG